MRVATVDNPRAVVLESTSGIVSERARKRGAQRCRTSSGLQPVPVFTYLANTIRKGDRQIPYSLVTATDLSLLPARRRFGARADARPLQPRTPMRSC